MVGVQGAPDTVPGSHYELPVEVDIVKNVQIVAICTALQNPFKTWQEFAICTTLQDPSVQNCARLGTLPVTSLTQ